MVLAILTTGRKGESAGNPKRVCQQRAPLKDGDFAGLCLLQQNYGLVGVNVLNGRKFLVMVSAGSGKQEEAQRLPLAQGTVYPRAEYNFKGRADPATFFYSLDGKSWQAICEPIKNGLYPLPHFIGYRFGLFNYATLKTGGFADFDYCRVYDKITNINA